MKIQNQQNFDIKLGPRPLKSQKSFKNELFWSKRSLETSLISKFCWICIFIRLTHLFNVHNGLNHIFSMINSYSINKNLGLMWIRPCKMPTKYWKPRFSQKPHKNLTIRFYFAIFGKLFLNELYFNEKSLYLLRVHPFLLGIGSFEWPCICKSGGHQI